FTTRTGGCSAVATIAGCRKAIPPSTARPTPSARPAASAATRTRSWSPPWRPAGTAAAWCASSTSAPWWSANRSISPAGWTGCARPGSRSSTWRTPSASRCSAAGSPRTPRCGTRTSGSTDPDASEDVAAQVRILDQFAQVVVDVGTVDGDRAAALVGGLVAQGVEQTLEHGGQAPGTDGLLALVDHRGDPGQAGVGVGGEGRRHPIGLQNSHGLHHQ